MKQESTSLIAASLAVLFAVSQTTAAPQLVLDATHITLRHKRGRCFGWPANGGIWSWGNEILVQFKRDENGGMVHMVKTTDGGLTWSKEALVSRVTEPSETRHDVALMPATVRVSPTKLVCCIRNFTAYPKKGWIDCRVSTDNGRTWKLASTPVGDEAGTTPPALLKLPDGRLVLTYGYRKPTKGPTSIRAKISQDQGATWGEELILRTGDGDEDIGYTRNALRPDGKIVTIYYWQEDEKAERDIAATIWIPPTRANRKAKERK
jgi:hypothetical protein